MTSAACTMPFDSAPYTLSGAVYGALLNHSSALAEIGPMAAAAPYHGLPRAPVLFVKPRNTLNACGRVEMPAGVPELECGANLGLVIGRAACNVSAAAAPGYIAGYVIVNDVSVPHDVFYRPSIRFKARDGFCPIGAAVIPRELIADPDALAIRSFVDGVLVQVSNTADLVRSTARLLAEVSEFMTLGAGDVLAVGSARPAPRVRAGQRLDIEIEGLGSLTTRFSAPS